MYGDATERDLEESSANQRESFARLLGKSDKNLTNLFVNEWPSGILDGLTV